MPQANLESRIMTLPALGQDGPDLLNQAHFYLKAEITFPPKNQRRRTCFILGFVWNLDTVTAIHAWRCVVELSRTKSEKQDQFFICYGTGFLKVFVRGCKYEGTSRRVMVSETIRGNINFSSGSLNVKVYPRSKSMAKEPSSRFHQDIGRGNPGEGAWRPGNNEAK